jgi:hypothetical protein
LYAVSLTCSKGGFALVTGPAYIARHERKL